MEPFPKIGETLDLPIQIPIHPFLLDHAFQSIPVLPAVQAMQILAAELLDRNPSAEVQHISGASFRKLLPLPKNQSTIDAMLSMESLPDGKTRVCLLTRVRTKSGMGRMLEHANLTFAPVLESPRPPVSSTDNGADYKMEVSNIYPGLIDFGDRFCNILEPVLMNPGGATTRVSGGCSIPGAMPLGSPFALDAAFHAACAWGKHYKNRICYPVSFEKRLIASKTRPGQTYPVQILFREEIEKALCFDLWLTDEDRTICETVQELRMKEV